MATVIFLLACTLAVAAAQLGLPCMQKDTIESKVRTCFSDLGDLVNLDPSDKSGAMGQVAKVLKGKDTCRHQELVVGGFNCYFNFIGNCLNIRKMLTSKAELRMAFSYACDHSQEMHDECLEYVPKDMLTCYMEKVKDRQVAILLGKAHAKSIEEETCGFLDEELKCLKTALTKANCPTSTSTVYYNFMERMIPGACRYRGLLDTLKHGPQIGDLLPYKMKSPRRDGPR